MSACSASAFAAPTKNRHKQCDQTYEQQFAHARNFTNEQQGTNFRFGRSHASAATLLHQLTDVSVACLR